MLPSADAAHIREGKLSGWVLADRGHGSHWRTVFHVTAEDHELVADALLEAARTLPVDRVLPTADGWNCELRFVCTLHSRRATIVSVWNVGADRAPHLVTAYPKP